MDEENEVVSSNDEKIASLLEEFEIHRNEVKKMITDLEDIRSKVDTLIPTSLDARYIRYFEEKVKSITALFNALLEMRKDIIKSVKDEIEIRRKIQIKDEDLDIENVIDVRKLAVQIEDFEQRRKEIQHKRAKTAENIKVMDGVEIPGINDGETKKENSS